MKEPYGRSPGMNKLIHVDADDEVRVAVLHPYNPKHGEDCSCYTLKPPGRCEFRHPTLNNRCTKPAGHEAVGTREERGHVIDLGPGNPGVHTEEFLRAKGIAFRELWRAKMKRGLKSDETKQLHEMVQKFHATEDP